MPGLVDRSGRTIRHIRISITDRCQLRCRYCLPEEGARLLPREDILRHEEIVAVTRAAVAEGISSARITGGEPLLRRGLLSLVREMAGIDGLEDLALTTNGLLLPTFAQPLEDAGLHRINIGLSSLDPGVFRELTRGGDLGQVLRGLEAALAAGLRPVKINVVVLRGINDDPAPFLDLTRRLPVDVRFIEFMPIGPLPSERSFVPIAELRERLDRHGPFEPAGPSTGWGPADHRQRIRGAPGSFATISSARGHACGHCNRIRLTSDGHLRPCLFSEREVDLRPALRPRPDPGRLRALLRAAVEEKPASLTDTAHDRENGRGMSQIGG